MYISLSRLRIPTDRAPELIPRSETAPGGMGGSR